MVDFIFTIDDNDDNIPVYEQEDDEPSVASKTDNSRDVKSKRSKGKPKSSETEINPEFSFSLDDVGIGGVVHPWDFTAARASLGQKDLNYTSIDDKIKRRRQTNGSDDDNDDLSDKEEIDEQASDMSEDETEDRVQLRNDEGAIDGSSGEGSDEDIDDEELKEQKKREYFEMPEEPADEDVPQTFTSMNLSRPIIKGLTHVGFVRPTLIQARTIPFALLGRDICGGAVTGSGKTAAFVIPILERLLYRPKQVAMTRVLILCPTRELAIQCHSVGSRLAQFTDIQFSLAVGGLNTKVQEAELKKRPDVVIATPGRLIDHIHNSPSFTLDHIEILVMDEADRMLEDGFADELNEIVRNCPKSRQTMLFSATMTDNVDELIRLSLSHPVRLFVDPNNAAAHKLVQEFVRIRSHRESDRPAILLALCKRTFKTKCIIFFRSKAAAHQMKIVFGLSGLNAAELHGNLSQEQRLEALEKFRDGEVEFLLATDLAARGLDIKGIETVINFNMPASHAQYLHRVGRTARAGRTGRSITFVGEADRKVLKMVIKNSPSGQVKHRVIPNDVVKRYIEKIESLKDDVESILLEEKEEKQLSAAERDMSKASNLLAHEKEIYSRPARTWFQSAHDKAKSAKASLDSHQNKMGVSDEKKRRRENAPKRDKLSGLSRQKKRRIMQREEDEKALKTSKAAIKGAKKAARPQKIGAMKNKRK
ncbi:P-loop containing nucleoside triphosphate hydrolase protein [Paraphysoderma sedebokerense]|nr:P-loop containing nucleoside triphosphate hydrolase protein [Paraphysoderma sedebokerense]